MFFHKKTRKLHNEMICLEAIGSSVLFFYLLHYPDVISFRLAIIAKVTAIAIPAIVYSEADAIKIQ